MKHGKFSMTAVGDTGDLSSSSFLAIGVCGAGGTMGLG